jgi:hypothetical protein
VGIPERLIGLDYRGDNRHIGNLSMKLRVKENKSDLSKIEHCNFTENKYSVSYALF